MRSSTLGRSGGLGILASNILFCLALADAGAAETMKLFRTAFWLGVVIYNLPSPDSQPAAPEVTARQSRLTGALCQKH